MPLPDKATLEDFLRIHDPHRINELDAIYSAMSDLPSVLNLEARYGAPGGLTAPELDVRSRFFNPRKALYAAASLPPIAGAQPFECLHRVPIPKSVQPVLR